jgi:hypothetical protein
LGLCEVAKYKGTRFLRRKKIRNGNNLLWRFKILSVNILTWYT